MLYALRVNFENFGHTTQNKIFRLVKLLADLSTRLNGGKYEFRRLSFGLTNAACIFRGFRRCEY